MKQDVRYTDLTQEEILKVIKGCKITPLGQRIVLFVPQPREMSEGGIMLPQAEEHQREHTGANVGYLVAIGPDAWRDMPGQTAVGIKLGVKVNFGKYAGRTPDENQEYRIMMDGDLDAILEGGLEDE